MADNIVSAIQKLSRRTLSTDGSEVNTITIAQTEQLAAQHGVSCRSIEIIALENDIAPLRYLRNFKTYSYSDQIRLLKSHVAVVGLGGLGGTVVELLARAGVGALTVIDGDAFEDHNLNRQLLCTYERLGTSKAKAARDRARAINASVDVTVIDMHLTKENRLRLIEDCQLAVDCLDNILTRFSLEIAAKRAGRPLVSAAVAGLDGHVTTIFPEDPGLSLIYGPREAVQNPKGAETTLGCLPQAVSLIASVECAEILKTLLGQTSHLLRNKLLIVDLKANTFEVLQLK